MLSVARYSLRCSQWTFILAVTNSCLSRLKLTSQCKDRKSHRSLYLDGELQIINKCWGKDDDSSLETTPLEGFPVPGGPP